MKKKFNLRGFLSLYIVLSFIIMTLSGIILYLSPAGRVANWSNWRFIGLLKSQWQAVHTIFTFIFVVAIAFHLFFNWRPLFAYLRTKIGSRIKLRKEVFGASSLAIFIFLLTVNNITPFNSVMDFGESLKDSWSTRNTEPPIPHAEELTIARFSETIQIPLEDVTKKLSDRGIYISSESQTIREISSRFGIAPSGIYNIVQSSGGKALNVQQEGRGYGKKTIAQICNEKNISYEEGISRLHLKGISADKDDKLKDVAARYNVTPIEIANAITNVSN